MTDNREFRISVVSLCVACLSLIATVGFSAKSCSLQGQVNDLNAKQFELQQEQLKRQSPYIVFRSSGVQLKTEKGKTTHYSRPVTKQRTSNPETVAYSSMQSIADSGGKIFLAADIGNIGTQAARIESAGYVSDSSTIRLVAYESIWCSTAETEPSHPNCSEPLATGKQMSVYIDITNEFDKLSESATTEGIQMCVTLPPYDPSCATNPNVLIKKS